MLVSRRDRTDDKTVAAQILRYKTADIGKNARGKPGIDLLDRQTGNPYPAVQEYKLVLDDIDMNGAGVVRRRSVHTIQNALYLFDLIHHLSRLEADIFRACMPRARQESK